MKKKLRKCLAAWLMIICMVGSALPVWQVSAEETVVRSDPIRVACVGDSITYGYMSSNPSTKSYPARLQELLGDSYVVRNFGRNSVTLLTDTELAYVDQQE